jgi:hypothetical protein
MFNKLKQVLVVSGSPPFASFTANFTIAFFAQIIHTGKRTSFMVRGPDGVASYTIFNNFIFNVV